MNKYEKTPRGKYTRQRCNALRRGLQWKMTFEEWWQIWQDSGKWEQRGQASDQYCMARINDEGPYSAGNVAIITMAENSRQSVEGKVHRTIRENTEWMPTPWADRESAWDIY
jgi:hypothetical protein